MPINKEQALTENMFHDSGCKRWRRNGKTQTWKTRPDEFRVPVKFGLRAYDQITHLNAHLVHVPGDEGCKEKNVGVSEVIENWSEVRWYD